MALLWNQLTTDGIASLTVAGFAELQAANWSDNWPVKSAAVLTYYDVVNELEVAARDRTWATGGEFWPAVTITHDAEKQSSYAVSAWQYTGIINSLVSNGDGTYTLTDSSKDWTIPGTSLCGGDLDGTFSQRWVNYSCPDSPWIPKFYDVVIEHDELNPWGVVRCQIVKNGTNTLRISGGEILDALTANQFGVNVSHTVLNNRRYCIVRRNSVGHPSIHWHDRWLDWPNATEYIRGFVTAAGVLADAQTVGFIEDEFLQGMVVNAFVGKHLMLRDTTGRLRRFAVMANTDRQLRFAVSGALPQVGSKWAVIDPNGRWRYPQHRFETDWWPRHHRLSMSFEPGLWYGGFDQNFSATFHLPGGNPVTWSRDPEGNIRWVGVAANRVNVKQFDGMLLSCEPGYLDTMDIDTWSGPEEKCPQTQSHADLPHAPDFFKAIIRSQQLSLEGGCTYFIEEKNWDNLAAIYEFHQAHFFRKILPANSFTVTIASASNTPTPHVTFGAVTLPADVIASEIYGGTLVHYAVLDANGVPLVDSAATSSPATSVNGTYGALQGTLISATRIDLRGPTPGESAANPSPYPPANIAAWVGKTLVFSLGW